MTDLDRNVADHYGSQPVLARIDAALRDMGVDPETPTTADLKPADEFHTGGLEATEALFEALEIAPGIEVLDIGCGLGGTARYLAEHHGARVTGVDLTPAYVEAGRVLTERVGLSGRVGLLVGSATALPLGDESVDLATMLHVGMNIPDKRPLFIEAARVLRAGGRFAIFDIMRDEGDDALAFPLPWAEAAETSFVAPPEDYEASASAAGLLQLHRRGRRDYALDFFRKVFAKVAEHGMPPIGIHLLMGETAPEKLRNYVTNIEARRILPVEMVFEKPK